MNKEKNKERNFKIENKNLCRLSEGLNLCKDK